MFWLGKIRFVERVGLGGVGVNGSSRYHGIGFGCSGIVGVLLLRLLLRSLEIA